MDEHEQQVREYVTRPWAERRGFEWRDQIATVILVRASLDELADVLTVKVAEYNRDVLDTEVRITDTSVFVYQLVGHTWSIIPGYLPYNYSLLELSKQLGQPVIRLDQSDSIYTVRYAVFDKGELVEYFSGSAGDDLGGSNRYGVEPQRYLLFPYEGDSVEDDFEEDDDDDDEYVDPDRQIAYFWSTRRQVTAEEISEISQFADRVLREYDAYVPDFNEGDVYFLGEVPTLGKTYRVQNPGTGMIFGYDPDGQRRKVISIPEFVRVDHYRF